MAGSSEKWQEGIGVALTVKLLGQRLSAREFDRQVAEFHIRVAVLNGFTALGIPVTEAVG